jgi:hypothetical protein
MRKLRGILMLILFWMMELDGSRVEDGTLYMLNDMLMVLDLFQRNFLTCVLESILILILVV